MLDNGTHLDFALALVALVEGDVHADHVLRFDERVLHIAVTLAQVFAARPSRFDLGDTVARQLRQAARVTAATVVRQTDVVSVGADRYGGLDRCVFLHAGVNLADAVNAEVVVKPAVVGGDAWSTCGAV